MVDAVSFNTGGDLTSPQFVIPDTSGLVPLSMPSPMKSSVSRFQQAMLDFGSKGGEGHFRDAPGPSTEAMAACLASLGAAMGKTSPAVSCPDSSLRTVEPPKVEVGVAHEAAKPQGVVVPQVVEQPRADVAPTQVEGIAHEATKPQGVVVPSVVDNLRTPEPPRVDVVSQGVTKNGPCGRTQRPQGKGRLWHRTPPLAAMPQAALFGPKGLTTQNARADCVIAAERRAMTHRPARLRFLRSDNTWPRPVSHEATKAQRVVVPSVVEQPRAAAVPTQVEGIAHEATKTQRVVVPSVVEQPRADVAPTQVEGIAHEATKTQGVVVPQVADNLRAAEPMQVDVVAHEAAKTQRSVVPPVVEQPRADVAPTQVEGIAHEATKPQRVVVPQVVEPLRVAEPTQVEGISHEATKTERVVVPQVVEQPRADVAPTQVERISHEATKTQRVVVPSVVEQPRADVAPTQVEGIAHEAVKPQGVVVPQVVEQPRADVAPTQVEVIAHETVKPQRVVVPPVVENLRAAAAPTQVEVVAHEATKPQGVVVPSPFSPPPRVEVVAHEATKPQGVVVPSPFSPPPRVEMVSHEATKLQGVVVPSPFSPPPRVEMVSHEATKLQGVVMPSPFSPPPRVEVVAHEATKPQGVVVPPVVENLRAAAAPTQVEGISHEAAKTQGVVVPPVVENLRAAAGPTQVEVVSHEATKPQGVVVPPVVAPIPGQSVEKVKIEIVTAGGSGSPITFTLPDTSGLKPLALPTIRNIRVEHFQKTVEEPAARLREPSDHHKMVGDMRKAVEAPMAMPVTDIPAAPQPVTASPQSQSVQAASARTEALAETVNQIVESIVGHISVTPALASGEGSIRITLNPTVLDGSEILITAESGTLNVMIAPATVAAEQLVAKTLTNLGETLAAHAPAFHHVTVSMSATKKGKEDETA